MNDDHAPVEIVHKRGNAVLVSKEDWDAMVETAYLSQGANGRWLRCLLVDDDSKVRGATPFDRFRINLDLLRVCKRGRGGEADESDRRWRPHRSTRGRGRCLTSRSFPVPGSTEPAVRVAAARGGELPEPLAGYAAKVRDQSYRLTDADFASLTAAGISDDTIFEITIAAAVGAALQRLDAGLRAVHGRA